jgi:tetratricopeptide (TPR) repeat protein
MDDRVKKIYALLKTNPDDNFLKHVLALESIKLGNDAEARKLFEEILTNDPGFVGSYYHLGRLLERNNESELAIKCYEKGMTIAKKTGESRAYNELKAAYEELIY